MNLPRVRSNRASFSGFARALTRGVARAREGVLLLPVRVDRVLDQALKQRAELSLGSMLAWHNGPRRDPTSRLNLRDERRADNRPVRRCRRQDSNLQGRSPTDLSDLRVYPFRHAGTFPVANQGKPEGHDAEPDKRYRAATVNVAKNARRTVIGLLRGRTVLPPVAGSETGGDSLFLSGKRQTVPL